MRVHARLGPLALAAAVSCSASFDGRVYRGEGYAFRIAGVPEGWSQVEHSHGALAFRDPAHHGTALLNGRCGLDGEDVPLQALTHHLFLQFTERRTVLQEVVPFDGREAMHTVLEARLDGVPLHYDVWVLKKDGCVYDLLYMAPQAGFERGRRAFLTMVKGFATVEADGH